MSYAMGGPNVTCWLSTAYAMSRLFLKKLFFTFFGVGQLLSHPVCYIKHMNDELNHWQPSCEEVYPDDFNHDCYAHWLSSNELSEDDVDSYFESRFDMGE